MQETFRGTRTLRFLWYEQHGLCTVCNTKITRLTGWHLHHCVPRVMGGSQCSLRSHGYFKLSHSEHCISHHSELDQRRLLLDVMVIAGEGDAQLMGAVRSLTAKGMPTSQ